MRNKFEQSGYIRTQVCLRTERAGKQTTKQTNMNQTSDQTLSNTYRMKHTVCYKTYLQQTGYKIVMAATSEVQSLDF